MSSFVPSKSHLRRSLLFLFHQKKKAIEAHRLLVETYGEHVPVIRTCETWLRQFKSGDFDLTDNEHPGAAKKFEDEELQVLLDEDPTQSQQQLAQTLDLFRELEAEKSCLSPGEVGPSTPRPNHFHRKTMLCVWWDQCGVVYFELLRPGETVNTDRYRQQIINLNQNLALDIFGPLPETQKGNRYIFSMQDRLTRYTVLVPLQNESTNSIIEALIDHYIYTFGAPKTILSDQGSNFLLELMTQFENALNIRHIKTTALHQQSNGKIERMHSTLVNLIKTSIAKNSKQWDENLKYINFVINTTTNQTTGHSPYN